MMKFLLGLCVLVLSVTTTLAADVRFSNHTPITATILVPHDGNQIDVYNPTAAAWQTISLSNSGVVSDVSNCYIDDVPGQSMPMDTIHLAWLKMDGSGNLYINWLTWVQSGPAKASGGFTIDARTQQGHLIGMAIRRPTYHVQGQANSEYVLSYYNRGASNFISVPAGTVSAGSGWQNVGAPIEMLVWADDIPTFMANINFTGSAAGSTMAASVLMTTNTNSGTIGLPNYWGFETSQVNVSPGKPYGGTIIVPLASPPPGFWRYQLQISVDVGTVTLGAARNSMMSASGKF